MSEVKERRVGMGTLLRRLERIETDLRSRNGLPRERFLQVHKWEIGCVVEEVGTGRYKLGEVQVGISWDEDYQMATPWMYARCKTCGTESDTFEGRSYPTSAH